MLMRQFWKVTKDGGLVVKGISLVIGGLELSVSCPNLLGRVEGMASNIIIRM